MVIWKQRLLFVMKNMLYLIILLELFMEPHPPLNWRRSHPSIHSFIQLVLRAHLYFTS